MDPERQATVLLVEDNPDHAEFALRAFKKGAPTTKVLWAKDGAEALDFLGRRGEGGAAPPPGLILLDIHLPKIDGHEVLRQIKTDPVLRTIPVVMLTTSDRPEDRAASADAGASAYVTKPLTVKLFEQLKALGLYWLFPDTVPA